MSNNFYSAFGNKIRNKLLICIGDKSKNVTELIKNCGLSQSAVSQHLNKLKKAKVVKTTRRGKTIYYTLTSIKASEISQKLLILEQEV